MRDAFLCTSPFKNAAGWFLGLLGVMTLCAGARHVGVMDADLGRRAIGVVLGVLAVVTGNFVPKLRPLKLTRRDPARVRDAERSAGWLLVATGLADVGLFVFAPLGDAGYAAALVGMAALILIAGHWIALAFWGRGELTGAVTQKPGARELGRQALVMRLLLAAAFVYACGCLKFLAVDIPAATEIAPWFLIVSGIAYALVSVRLDRKS